MSISSTEIPFPAQHSGGVFIAVKANIFLIVVYSNNNLKQINAGLVKLDKKKNV